MEMSKGSENHRIRFLLSPEHSRITGIKWADKLVRLGLSTPKVPLEKTCKIKVQDHWENISKETKESLLKQSRKDFV